MTDTNTESKPDTKPGNGGNNGYSPSPQLIEVQKALPAYIENQRQRADLMNELQFRVSRLEVLLAAHGIDLDDV